MPTDTLISVNSHDSSRQLNGRSELATSFVFAGINVAIDVTDSIAMKRTSPDGSESIIAISRCILFFLQIAVRATCWIGCAKTPAPRSD